MRQKLLPLALCFLAFALVFKVTDTWLEQTYDISSMWVIALAIGYFLGSIPFGLILTRFFVHQDLREIGSGNIGATNVLRTGKKALALITLFLDLMKGVLAIFAVRYFIPNDQIAELMTATGALLGHCYPIWLNFKGGKAVATGAGILFALNPVMGAVAGAVWVLTLVITRYSSLSGLLACLSAPITAYLQHETKLFYFTIFLTFLIFFRHHSNIKRLFSREEPKIGK